MSITRRTVLKSIAAALMAPTIRLRPEIDREALMRPFCGEDFRYAIDQPFQQGSLTYCTDARRIIRAELSCPEINGERRLPNAAGLWKQYWGNNPQWIPVERPELNELLLPRGDDYQGVCPLCLGRRISLGDTYPDFDDKTVDRRIHDLQYDVDDNSIGDAACERCHGREYWGPSEVEFSDGIRFRYDMLAPMYDLPGLMVSPTKYDGLPMPFKADGFEGMIMPLASPEPRTCRMTT